MEEKNTKNPNMKIEGKTEGQEQNRKATYEELNNYCIQLYNQNKQLIEQLKQREMAGLFKRLEFLFKVVENSGKFDPAFVGNCTAEITQALTPEPNSEAEQEKGKEA